MLRSSGFLAEFQRGLIGAVVACCLLPGGAEAAEGASDPVAIVNVKLLDGRGGAPVPGAVVVRGERIQEVGGEDLALPATARILDGRDGYLVPGFIDMHAHLLLPRCKAQGKGWSFDPEVSKKMLAALLDFGITTLRSPATPTLAGLALRDDLNAGRLRGPRAFAAAELINDRSLDAAQLREVVRETLPHRPDFIKVYASLEPEAVAVVIDEAHAHGIPVIGHLGRTSWLEASRLGIDHLTHAVDWSVKTLRPERRGVYAAARARGVFGVFHPRIVWLEQLDLESAEVRDMIAALVAKGITVDPTLIAYDAKFAAPGGGRYARDPFVDVVPELRDDWISCPDITRTAAWTPADYRRWNAAYPKMQALVRLMQEAGVVLTTGTDLTNPWVIPGRSLHQEFELLAAAGLAPGEVLRMTGANAARSLGSRDIGIIEKGRRADLVLLAEDPLADIRNTQSIVWVMQGGEIVSSGPIPSAP